MPRFAGEEFGVLLGKGKEHDHLEIGVAFVEREKAPRLGEFIVTEEREFMRRKFLCRVEEMDYGDFQTTKGERQRALVEKYLRDRSGYGRELSEEEKKGLFFRHYALKVLGELRDEGVVTEYRLLPELSSTCRYPTVEELKAIVSAGIQDPAKAVNIGKLAVGNECDEDVDVSFEPWKFERRRTAVFARTGYGKSNLCKVVVALAALRSKAGILVVDIDGEYGFETTGIAGQPVPGLADIDLLKPKLSVYSDRHEMRERYPDVAVRPILNLGELSAFQVAELMVEERAAVENFRNLDRNEQVWEAWGTLVDESQELRSNRREFGRRTEDFISTVIQHHLIQEGQRAVLRRELLPLLELHSPEAGNIVKDVLRDLWQGRLVILDLSLMALDRATQVVGMVLNEVFRRNVRGITTDRLIKVIAVFEEAQNVLNKKQVEDGRSIFVRWAKEGRKYNLGLIYVSQQPGGIAEEIVSQTDNYFVMHLLNKGDIDSLERANRHYGGVVAQFLSDETIVGNAYVYSAPYQPYIFPAKVFEFKTEFFKHEFGEIDMQKVTRILEPVVSRDAARDWKKVVGEAGYKLYEYFKEAGIEASFLDDAKKWLDYSYVDGLLRGLHRSGLIHCPQLAAQDTVPGMAGSGGGPTEAIEERDDTLPDTDDL